MGTNTVQHHSASPTDVLREWRKLGHPWSTPQLTAEDKQAYLPFHYHPSLLPSHFHFPVGSKLYKPSMFGVAHPPTHLQDCLSHKSILRNTSSQSSILSLVPPSSPHSHPLHGTMSKLTSCRDCRDGDFLMPGPPGGEPPGAGSCSML